MDDTQQEEVNEQEIRRIRHVQLLRDIEQARVQSMENAVVEGLRAKGLLPVDRPIPGWCDICAGFTHAPWCEDYVEEKRERVPADVLTEMRQLAANWNQKTRIEQIVARYRIHDLSGIPNDEYTASWADVKLLIDERAHRQQLITQLTTKLERQAETVAQLAGERDALIGTLDLVRQLLTNQTICERSLCEGCNETRQLVLEAVTSILNPTTRQEQKGK